MDDGLIQDDLEQEIREGVNAILTFTAQDAEDVVALLSSKIHVKLGFEKKAELELRPAIKEAVLGTSFHVNENGEMVAKFKDQSSEDAFIRLRQGGTWYASIDVLEALKALYQ